MYNIAYDKIRLEPYEVNSIIDLFKNIFPDDNLWLFGSRAKLDRKGGDIDLFIETNLDLVMAHNKRIEFICAICDKIGDQKIDVVVNSIGESETLPIHQKAKTEGVKLV